MLRVFNGPNKRETVDWKKKEEKGAGSRKQEAGRKEQRDLD